MKLRSALPMKVAKYGYIVISLVFCMAGISMMLLPVPSASTVGTFFGVTMVLFGIIKLIGYFSKDLFRLAFQYDLQFGILLCILGVIILTLRKNPVSFVCVSYGISIIADSLFKCRTALEAKKFGISKWWFTLLLAIITSVMGVIVTISPAMSLRITHIFLGISLLCEGALGLNVAISMVKIIDHQRPDVMDGKYYE